MLKRNNFNLSILLIVVFFLSLIFLLFAINLANVSVIEDTFEGSSPKVVQNVKIYKNPSGIPHIVAPVLEDCIFGIGFAQASDRLWQMDFLRRVAYGKLSEVMGKDLIKFDQYFRALELKKISAKVYENLDPKSKKIFEAFSNGVNYYIETFSKKLPVEFQTLKYKPEPWQPVDCIAIGRLMGYSMSFSFWLDLTYFDIANKIGTEKTALLFPLKFDNYTEFLPDSLRKINVTIPNRLISQGFPQTSYSLMMEEVEKFFPIGIFPFGSNTWAVSVGDKANRRGILASDPHLKLSLPPLWYQIHFTTDEMNVVGLVIPGIPLPLIGRNDYIAWGITNGMVDDCDFFVHNSDPTGKFVVDSTTKIRITLVADTIPVKNSPNYIYYQRFIGKDIIFSDFLLLKDSTVAPNFYGIKSSPSFAKNICLTFKWTGQYVSDEIKTLYQICKAKNWNEFSSAKKYWGVPALNFSYADKWGNIGLMLVGVIPERQGLVGILPASSTNSKSAWIGFRKLGDEFNIFNPPEGFVFNANNKTFNNQVYLGSYWSDPSRAFRIFLLLNKMKPEDMFSIQSMQKDQHSEQAKFVLSHILPILNNHKNWLDTVETKALKTLESWDNLMRVDGVAPSIYQMFVLKFLENTLKDELGEALFRQFLYLDFIPARKFLEFISDSTNVFFNNVATKEQLSKDYIVVKSFKNAVTELRTMFRSNNINDFKYGEWHKLQLEHPFSKVKFFSHTFSMEKVSIGGNNSTINYAGSKLFDPGNVEVGPSARFIADLQDTLVWWILPGGNSGQVTSKNYSDQFQLWLSGGYISVSMSKIPNARFKLFASISKGKN
jgi:penicillin amidase